MATRTRTTARRRSPAHTVTFTPELKKELERYAHKHNLPFGAAVRVLVTDQLQAVKRRDELLRVLEWQIEEGWAEAEAIAGGDRSEVSRAEIAKAHRAALARLAKRTRRAG